MLTLFISSQIGLFSTFLQVISFLQVKLASQNDNCRSSIISFPDLAGGRSRRRDLVKSDLYHVIVCQECGRQVNSACLRLF